MPNPSPNLVNFPGTAPVTSPSQLQHFMVGLVPFTAVPFAGPDFLLALGRIAAYSGLAYLTYNKIKPLSYGFMGAAGVSLATSLMAGVWGKK